MFHAASPQRSRAGLVWGLLLCLLLAWAAPAAASQSEAFLGAQGQGGASAAAPVEQDEAFVGAQGQGRTLPGATAPAKAPPAAPAPAPARPATGPGPNNNASPAMNLLDRGEFAAAAGRFEEAERLWRQTLQLRPGWTVVERRLAELPQRRGSFPHDLSVNEARRQARLAFVQGVTEFNAQRYDQALEQFHRFLAVFPSDPEGLQYLDLTILQMDLVSGGSVSVQSNPQAEVFLDGQACGWTPVFLEWVQAGPHRVEVAAHGGGQYKDIMVSGRSTLEVSFTLLGGGLTVNSQPWAEVFLDGAPQGRTPLTLENLVLGPHRVGVSRQGFHDQYQDVILMQDQTQAVSFTLQPR
ncbi:MAG: PEGA domain-containing protein [Desulfarculus sp.]|nr:PEGA domain-containing protein [Desulfarculus sp.]